MTLDEARELLAHNDFAIDNETRLPSGTGMQIRLANGSIVNVFDSGTANVQGVANEEVKALFRAPVTRRVAAPAAGGVTLVAAPTEPKRNVFVVYGHDPTARDQLEATLRRWGLEPLILDQLPTEGQTVIEKLESAMEEVDFAIVLATPDDEGYRMGHPDEKAYRARQNVVLEMGMLLAKLGRENVAILLKTQEEMERPSDITGLIYVPFRDNIANDAGVLLAKAMVARGYSIDVAKL